MKLHSLSGERKEAFWGEGGGNEEHQLSRAMSFLRRGDGNTLGGFVGGSSLKKHKIGYDY